MTRDETIALWERCEAARRAAKAEALAAGKDEYRARGIAHEAAKAVWNGWADELLAERAAMEADGRWAAKKDWKGNLEPQNNATRDWMDRAAAVFTRCHFLVRGVEGTKVTTGEDEKGFPAEGPSVKTLVCEDGSANFSGFKFPSYADFGSAAFSGADFRSAAFSGADFRRAAFSGPAYFALAKFEGYAGFASARFEGEASFNAIRCDRAFSLADATFKQVPDFIQAHFEEAPRLDNVRVAPRMIPAYPPLEKRKGEDGNEIAPTRWQKARHWTKRLASLPRRFAIGARRRIGSADRDLPARWRALKRLAVQAHDHDREHEFFAGELRAARFAGDWPWPKPLFEARGWLGCFSFWAGLVYGLTSNYGRSILLPFLWWCAGVAAAAMFYFGEHRAMVEARPLPRPWGETANRAEPVSFRQAWWDGAASACFSTPAQRADEAAPRKEKPLAPAIEVVGLSVHLRDQTGGAHEALQLALRDGLLILYGDADTAHRTYGCLYGVELYGGGTPVAIVPPQVGDFSAIHKLYSAVMIFLFGLALRNMLKMR